MAAVVLALIGLTLAVSWNRTRHAVKATTPAEAPVEVPRSTPALPPQADGQIGVAIETSGSPRSAEIQDVPQKAPPAIPVTGTRTGKAKPPVKQTPEPERREAALKALGKDEATASAEAKKADKDRRSSSLDALKK